MNDRCGRLDIRVRYVEVDRMGYVHHSAYWVYFEMGRTDLLRASGVSYLQYEQAGAYLVVVKGSVRYLAPARYDDELILTTRVSKVGRASIDHAYELHRKCDSALLARAQTTLACVDAGGKLRPLPDTLC